MLKCKLAKAHVLCVVEDYVKLGFGALLGRPVCCLAAACLLRSHIR